MRSTGGATRSSVEGPVMGLEQRGCVVQLLTKEQPKKGKILLEKVKSFNIKRLNDRSRMSREIHVLFVLLLKPGMIAAKQSFWRIHKV